RAPAVERAHPGACRRVRAAIDACKGRVYLDCCQNGYGRTSAAPCSARPVPGATVSTPVRWSEVNEKRDPRAFTLKAGPARMRKLKRDPLAKVLELDPDVTEALERLRKRLGA